MTSTDVERREKILQIVGQRQRADKRTTKAIVIREMINNKLASRQTTHNLIKELIYEGKLNMEEINPQVHFLTINDKNEFNRIYSFVSELEMLIDKINTTIKKTKDDNFISAYKEAVDLILDMFFQWGLYSSISENDARIIDRQLTKLSSKISQVFIGKGSTEALDFIVNKRLKTLKSSPFIEDIIDFIERCKNQFLIDTSGQKKTS